MNNIIIVIGIILSACFTIILTIIASPTETDYKQEAIDRGYALYCPTTGKFAWIDECEE